MPVTGVADLIQRMRQEIASAKQEGQDAVNYLSTSVATFRESADAVKQVGKELRDEAQALRDAIGEVSNGGPPLDTPSQ
jgi:NTP pyrophosphatase (non-canonical NTP hydrolase)